MPYLAYENAMLERFRAKHRELLAEHAHVQLYAVADPAALAWHGGEGHSAQLEGLQRVSLYAGSGLDTLEATGPVLLAMPDLRTTSIMTSSNLSTGTPTPTSVFVRLLAYAKRNAAYVTWVWSPHAMDALVEHLQTLLHARLEPDGEDAWFFFYQPSHLQVLHQLLPDDTRRHMFGPIHAWWLLDPHGKLVELTGESAHVPPAWDAFAIPADVVSELQRVAMPKLVLAWLEQCRLNLTATSGYNDQLAEITPLVERALSYGLASKTDVGTFVVYGLHYKVDYDQHPQLQAVLNDPAARGPSLATAYSNMHADVWRELAQTTQQRVDARATLAYHEKLRKAGHLRILARLVNATGDQVNGAFFDLHLPGEKYAQRQRVVDIKGRMFEAVELDIEPVLSLLPGAPIRLTWTDYVLDAHRQRQWMPRQRDLVIEGELPTNEKSGLLEIRFMQYGHAAVVMHKDEAAYKNTRKEFLW